MKQHWSSQERIKYIKQNGVTQVNHDGCRSVLTLWFKKELPKSRQTPCPMPTRAVYPRYWYTGLSADNAHLLIEHWGLLALSHRISQLNQLPRIWV